jgi:DNA-binding XRE family transcriptional regulator
MRRPVTRVLSPTWWDPTIHVVRYDTLSISPGETVLRAMAGAGLSQTEIAATLGVTKMAVSRWERRVGIVRRRGRPPIEISAEVVRRLVSEQGLSLRRAAERLAVSDYKIRRLAREHGIRRAGRGSEAWEPS